MNLDINDAAPSSLSHLIGNDNVKRSIQVALDFAQTEGTAFPSTLPRWAGVGEERPCRADCP